MYFKTLCLFNVYLFFNFSIEKIFLYIHMMKTPSHGRRKRHNISNRGICGKRRKNFVAIFSLLEKPSSYEHCLVFVHVFVYCMFDLIDPFLSYHRFFLGSRHDFPYIIFHDRLDFFCHDFFPLFILSCTFKCGGFFIYNIFHTCFLVGEYFGFFYFL
jgi:hypothetical protein